MEAAVHPLQRAADQGGIGDVADDQIGALRQVVAMAGGQIVQHPDGVAARDQRVAQMRTDEPRAAGDQEAAHARPSAPGYGYRLHRAAAAPAAGPRHPTAGRILH